MESKTTQNSGITKQLKSATAGFIGPFVVFMVLLQIVQWIRTDAADASWWTATPEHWGYPLQAVICLALVWCWSRHYPAISWRGYFFAVSIGLIGFVIWVMPPLFHSWLGVGTADLLPWLSRLGFEPRLDGFDPWAFGEDTSPAMLSSIIGFRFLRLVITVALIEEIFWRGFLMRWLAGNGEDWAARPIGEFKRGSFWITSLAFALAHFGPDFFVALIYGTLAGWVTVKTKNLWAVVLMHAVTNLCLGLFIMKTNWWGLW